MAERIERLEVTEQTMSPELRDQLIENYLEFGREAEAGGHRDMAEYYQEKANELKTGDENTAGGPETAGDRQAGETGRDMAAYYEAKKQKILQEKQEREAQWRMDKAVHGAPDYAGFGGWRESEYVYEAEKEYARNGNSAEYRRLLEGAAKAHVREQYRDILR